MKDYDEINEITDVNEDTEKKDRVCLTKSDFAEMGLVFAKIAILIKYLKGRRTNEYNKARNDVE